MKIKIFDHNDLDAIGIAILGIIAFGKENIDITYCNYDDINNKVKEFIDNKEYDNFDHVYITDISINEELAEYITNYHPESFKSGFNLAESFTLIDHHPTALSLNKYWWCNVVIENDVEKVSGTSLFYKELIEQEYLQNTYNWKYDRCESIYEFVEKVKRYDTWLWSTKYNDMEAKQLNDLFYIYGRDKFIEKIIYQLTEELKFEFDSTDKLLLELEENNKQKYIEARNKELQRKELLIDDKQYVAGVVFAEQYISQLGNELAKLHPEYDFIIMISGGKTVSYRGIKEDIDLGLIAKHYGGGGHKSASGSQISDKERQNIIDLILK